ncbi:unnamed protein product, partial [Rotaria sordida]
MHQTNVTTAVESVMQNVLL